MATKQINVESGGERLDTFLSSKLDLTRSQIKQMQENGQILLNGKITKCGKILKQNDLITVEQKEAVSLDILPQKLDLEIIYEDEHIAVINKPQGISVHPSGKITQDTLVNALLYSLKNLSSINGVIRPGIVHRLDKDTSGVMVIAKNNNAHLNLSNQFKERTVKKEYLAILEGNLKDEIGTIKTQIGRSEKDRKKMAVLSGNNGREAITKYKVIERFNSNCLVSFNILTGRTHQIRVHAKHIGHPVVGDNAYGYKKCRFKFLSGQLLHSHTIEFDHPKTNKRLSFSAPLPDYFEKTLQILKTEANQD